MSKINAVRFINLNYNNNAMKINDECMQFSGKSTLLSLRNGGGKTVLVQMMTAPFVHRGKQKTKDRPFESYFTTAKPSFILVEWLLDGGAGYVLTGLMVRKNQEISEEKTDALEMMAIISEYKEPCMQDIHHLPVVEQNEKTMKLKSYNSCRKLFEDYKKDKKLSFFCYDMSSPAQSRQYFYKLMEYQINYKEWETIIRKVNVKESGLSELFSDCRTEKELVEKWFLEAVESKLNKEENKVKNFQEILEKYAGKYKNIKEQLKRRDAIQKFKEAAEEIQINAEDFLVKEGEKIEQEKVIAAFIARLNVLYEEAEIERERQEEGRKKLQEELEFLKYEQLSCEFHEKNREKRNHASNREMIDLEKESLLRKQEKIQKKVHVFLCAKQQEMVNEDKQEWEIRKEKAAISRTKEENLEPERNRIGGQLSGYYEYRLSDNKEKQEAIKKQKLQIRKDISQQKDILNEYREKTKKITESKGSFRSLVRGYDNIEIKYNSNYRENLSRNILGVYEAGMLIRDYNDIIRCVQKCRETLAQTLNKIARQEAFQDASYKTPLENMLKVCDNAAKVLRQLNITLESYDSLMKQLEVDISLVETEKKNVTELLEDYVQNIHKNLEKIGRNSTIKIREKSIKMLKVILPVWEDNEKLYSLRLSDLVDEITEEGIRLFENNENAQEYIGRKVTSKNLYDTVVGTGNVQIQLYKIEEQREQQISWNQVAKNSGGEGFLSAFVILSSLLDYMRKDDSDIFMDKNEGKVLLMDNPFAQTNAEHLLKPLMNLADKTNTQLICLTGLGGESIYNRFDNIYVLNLIEAHLRNGIQYLRPEHKKGEEVKVETILPTHIEVEEMLF